MLEALTPLKDRLADAQARIADLRSVFDIAAKEKRIREIETLASDANFWNDPGRAQALMREMATLKSSVGAYGQLSQRASDAAVMIELADESDDEAAARDAENEVLALEAALERAERALMFSGKHDHADAILSIQPGAGGVDAQDWAAMLYRMYLRWAERHGFKVSEIDYTPAEVAGIKNVTLQISGDHAYGYLRSERGVHRLVRLSPFNAGNTRETSFARVDVYPDIQDSDIHVEINPNDLEIDTYRSQGAGGQNVQKNESAVRIRHIPTGIVVTCQDQRSQMQNRERAMHILKVRLQELEERKREAELRQLRGEHVDAEFGNQIRNYVLHPYRLVKDTRTGYETSQTDEVLDGDLDAFMEAYLKLRIEN
ncbi:MAG: peptide chain release factor 2 [Anaerolineae bacterium]|nr:peptide chain release factor 2 [Candidatus Roseilinea sp.]MDW8450920.1 peptide chain release factor 2 [Anaerolineae bacterium]